MNKEEFKKYSVPGTEIDIIKQPAFYGEDTPTISIIVMDFHSWYEQVNTIHTFNPEFLYYRKDELLYEDYHSAHFSDIDIWVVTKEINAEEPKNNDNRVSCYWCGAPTKKHQGFNKVYNICFSCQK
jgi:hypothetical protein